MEPNQFDKDNANTFLSADVYEIIRPSGWRLGTSLGYFMICGGQINKENTSITFDRSITADFFKKKLGQFNCQFNCKYLDLDIDIEKIYPNITKNVCTKSLQKIVDFMATTSMCVGIFKELKQSKPDFVTICKNGGFRHSACSIVLKDESTTLCDDCKTILNLFH